MLNVGLLYIALGILLRLWYIRLPKDRLMSRGSTRRISTNFIMVGSFNVLVFLTRIILFPENEFISIVIGASAVILFGFFVLMELNRNYRQYRDHMDKILDNIEE